MYDINTFIKKNGTDKIVKFHKDYLHITTLIHILSKPTTHNFDRGRAIVSSIGVYIITGDPNLVITPSSSMFLFYVLRDKGTKGSSNDTAIHGHLKT